MQIFHCNIWEQEIWLDIFSATTTRMVDIFVYYAICNYFSRENFFYQDKKSNKNLCCNNVIILCYNNRFSDLFILIAHQYTYIRICICIHIM